MIYEDKNKYKVEYIGEKFSKDLTSYKLIIIGMYGVGKTTTIHRLMNKEPEKEYAPTMSIDIKNVQVKVNDTIIQINIWDCCGNDKFALSTPNLFKNASVTILIYAIDNKQSYNDLENWYNMLKNNSNGGIIFLIGNKNDLEEKEREVKIEEGEKFKNNYDDIKMFFEASALKGNNMDKLLENISISIYEKNKIEENEEDKAIRKTITLNKEDFTKNGEEEGKGKGKGDGKKKKKKRFC